MKRIIQILTIGIALVSGWGCAHDTEQFDRDTSVRFDLTFTVNGMDSGNRTRTGVPASDAEKTVNTLHLFFFRAEPMGEGEFVACISLYNDLEMEQVRKVSHDKITVADAYNVIAVANIADGFYISGSIEDWVLQWVGSNEKHFSENVLASISFGGSIPSNWIPMSGTTTKAAGSGKIELSLTRVVSRLDVINSVSGYDLASASVWNAYYLSSLTGERVMDYSTGNTSLRTQKFYGVTGVTGNRVAGELYAFENQVITPENGDRFTTCIIVELVDGVGKSHFYRINIHPNGSPQNLRRNNSYTLTITGVNGDGYDDEQDAYTGKSTGLTYTINYWDLDDNGLIVSDMNSILAIPVKTIRIGKEATVNSYTITTFSTLPSPAPLAIKSQAFQPADNSLKATLSGNTLYITASDLPNGEPDRTGLITLSYADLEASINVVQSVSVDKYLDVTLDDGFSPLLPATALASSENIYVNASGPWTATLYDSNTDRAFSLSSAGNQPTDEISYVDYPSNRFRIYTWTNNDGPNKYEKKGFVLISLDEDPLNYVSVVPVSQRMSSDIDLVPDIAYMTFDGSGSVTYPATGINRIRINAGGTLTKIELSGLHPTKFRVDDSGINYTYDNSGTIYIHTDGLNTSGDSYHATMSVFDNLGGTASVALVQNSLGIYLTPSTISANITAVGGDTEYIRVSTGDPSSRWSAAIDVGSIDGDVFNHKPYFMLENDDRVYESLSGIPVDKRFKVVFPKIYYPNREKRLRATVTVEIDGSGLKEQITAEQSALTSNGVMIWTSNTDHYGAIGNTYAQMYTSYINSYRGHISSATDLKKGTGSGNLNAPGRLTSTSPSDYTYVHISNYGMPAAYDWSNVNSFRGGVDGITYLACDEYGDGPVRALNSAGSPLNQAGYTISKMTGNTGYNLTLNTGAADTRVYQVIMNRAVTPITGGLGGFYKDDVATGASQVPSTGVVLLRNPGGLASLIVDPASRLVYNGEGQIFWNTAHLSGNNLQFMKNLVGYVCRAAMYGSHFTDMFIDHASGAENYIAAPWDAVWEGNAWPNNEVSDL